MPNTNETEGSFYHVSQRKFLILYISTLGYYKLYWFYRQWQTYGQTTGRRVWAPIRGLFYVFFVYSLFQRVAEVNQRKGRTHRWRPKGLALTVILITIANLVAGMLSTRDIGTPSTHFVELLNFPLLAWVLVSAQQAINQTNAEPDDTLTTANIIWIGAGIVLWIALLLTLIGKLSA